MKFICPLIVVEDIERSREFYIDVLSQTVEFDFGENIQFHGPFAIHQKDHYHKLISINQQRNIVSKCNNMELYFESEQLDKIEHKLKDYEAEFIHNILEQPWGQRVIRFYDPDGHIIEVGESMDTVIKRYHNNSMNAKEISNKTSMPLEYVKSLIQET